MPTFAAFGWESCGATIAFLCFAYGALVRLNTPLALLPILGLGVVVQFRHASWQRISLGTLALAVAILRGTRAESLRACEEIQCFQVYFYLRHRRNRSAAERMFCLSVYDRIRNTHGWMSAIFIVL